MTEQDETTDNEQDAFHIDYNKSSKMAVGTRSMIASGDFSSKKIDKLAFAKKFEVS